MKKIPASFWGSVLAGFLILCIALTIGNRAVKKNALKFVPNPSVEESSRDNQAEENLLPSALQQEAEIKKLDIDIIEPQADERLFSISIHDFIASYNGYYWQDRQARYLLPPDQWQYWEFETGIHSKSPTNRYQFSQNKEIWTLPTITVYTPRDSFSIQEITVNFDDHGYAPSLRNIYHDMCYYALKVFFPDFSKDKIVELYTKLNQLAYENFTEIQYTSESIPSVVYYKDGIGLYPYFAVGQFMHLCIIPVTQAYLEELEKQGVPVYEIPS